MLRALLIYLSRAGWARRFVQSWAVARRMAARFVAGETLEEAVQVVQNLNQRGITATLDHLGEHVGSREEARRAAEEILEIIDRLDREQAACGVSIKLSQLGLDLDLAFCRDLVVAILERAKTSGIFLRIDMEESRVTEQTLDLFRQVRNQGFEDFVGIVLQSYLYRSEEDLRKLLQVGSKVRLCKGAYREPPEVAYPKKRDVDKNFDHLTRLLLDASLARESRISDDGVFPPIPAIATHDEQRIHFARQYAGEIDLPSTGMEFQMLYGIRSDLQEHLTAEGYPVRVYVPYGTEWYPYFVRRLAERPANLWFFLSNYFRG